MQAFHSRIPIAYFSRVCVCVCVCDTSPQLFDPLEWSDPLTLPFFTTLSFLSILFTRLSFHKVVTTITPLHALSSFILPPSYSPGEIPTLDKSRAPLTSDLKFSG